MLEIEKKLKLTKPPILTVFYWSVLLNDCPRCIAFAHMIGHEPLKITLADAGFRNFVTQKAFNKG